MYSARRLKGFRSISGSFIAAVAGKLFILVEIYLRPLSRFAHFNTFTMLIEGNKKNKKYLGQKKLTVEEISALPKTEKGKYLRELSAEDHGIYISSLFLENLNA